MQDKITNQCSISVSENEPEDAMITKKNRFVQIESFDTSSLMRDILEDIDISINSLSVYIWRPP